MLSINIREITNVIFSLSDVHKMQIKLNLTATDSDAYIMFFFLQRAWANN